MSGLYGTPGWDEPEFDEDDPAYDDDPPEPKRPRQKHYNRGGAGKRKGKSPHQHVRNWQFSMPGNVTFMRDFDYRFHRIAYRGGPINVRKVWRKTIHRYRLNRHRLQEIAF